MGSWELCRWCTLTREEKFTKTEYWKQPVGRRQWTDAGHFNSLNNWRETQFGFWLSIAVQLLVALCRIMVFQALPPLLPSWQVIQTHITSPFFFAQLSAGLCDGQEFVPTPKKVSTVKPNLDLAREPLLCILNLPTLISTFRGRRSFQLPTSTYHNMKSARASWVCVY